MSRRRAYKQETLDIQQRFFDTLQLLLDEKKIPGGINGFCEAYDIDKRHLYAQRADKGKGYFETGWLVPLIKFFGVNAVWLMLGTGKQFRRSHVE